MADNSEDTVDSEFEYRSMTTAEVVEKIEEAWQNEKLSPDLLTPMTDLLECIIEQIKATDESVSALSSGDLVCSILKLELDRIKFIVCSYLRTRLQKIEKYIWHYLDKPSCLSVDELRYAKEFAHNLDGHFKEVVLQHLPTNFQAIDKKKAIPRPNMNRYVFMRAIDRMDNIPVTSDGSETMDIESGTQLILPYQPVAGLIKERLARLI